MNNWRKLSLSTGALHSLVQQILSRTESGRAERLTKVSLAEIETGSLPTISNLLEEIVITVHELVKCRSQEKEQERPPLKTLLTSPSHNSCSGFSTSSCSNGCGHGPLLVSDTYITTSFPSVSSVASVISELRPLGQGTRQGPTQGRSHLVRSLPLFIENISVNTIPTMGSNLGRGEPDSAAIHLIDNEDTVEDDESEPPAKKLRGNNTSTVLSTTSSPEGVIGGGNNNLKKRGRKPLDKQDLICYHCLTRVTPEWRRGPSGLHTLCNACGLKYAKILKRPPTQRNAKPGDLQFILNKTS